MIIRAFIGRRCATAGGTVEVQGRSGFVLLCVLWVLAVLTVVTLGFGQRTLLDRRAAALSVDHAQARFMARGAVERGIAELRNRIAAHKTMIRNDIYVPFEQWPGPPDLLQEGGVYELDGADSQGDQCTCTIRDAERYISVNMSPKELLEEIPGIRFETVSAIMERRGPKPREPENPFVGIEEIRTLENVSDEGWFGRGKTLGFQDMLTIWGDGKINLNTASEDVLRCVPDLDEGVLEAVIAFRKGPDGELGTGDDKSFRNLRMVSRDLNISAERMESLLRYCKTESRFFTITGFATQRQGRVRAASTAVVRMRGSEAILLEWREKAFDL